ncbi:MAG: methylated-DNA--[protein]-cysteine S-methyltransferase [Candidatus Merdivicinus sp.]|jgi:methylated-DNA-[protein]-cysteine S-methyltransferase
MESRMIQTPIGWLTIWAEDEFLIRIDFGIKGQSNSCMSVLLDAEQQLCEYFARKRQQFDLSLRITGTEFQRKVWTTLQQIPYGQVKSYGEIAAQIGNPKACRAVGMANNRNPLPIVIPCHRVVGSNGRLVGYAGGISIKEELLRLEGVRL